MKAFVLTFAMLAFVLVGRTDAQSKPQGRPEQVAQRVTIVRDDHGIAHIHGKSDADAVFGMIYAQCEDDFSRVEKNYLDSLGRSAEATGQAAIWQDLRQRLFIDPDDLQRYFKSSPPWLQALMIAWADGINFYLSRHPETHPLVLGHFEPWMALSFTEGSIGGDIERVDLGKLESFYNRSPTLAPGSAKPLDESLSPDMDAAQRGIAQASDLEPRGSNGIAISPSVTKEHHALLLINPHTSFFFRSEQQVTSDSGLNAYGAATWGQFFIYQGFNQHAGWMHTSSGVDAVDQFRNSVISNGSGFRYRYGTSSRVLHEKQISIAFKTPRGLEHRTFRTFFTHRGPVIAGDGSNWVDIELMNTPVAALEQSYLRTKAAGYAAYKQTMELKANSSNNTIYADADGTIAYWHGDFIPKRDTKFDYTKLVDGSDPATDWQGLLPLAQVPQLRSPASGYLFNVNDSPWNGAGVSSLRRADFPAYVEQGIESARGVHAICVLAPLQEWTLESLMSAAYDSYLPWFARTIPALLAAWDAKSPQDAAAQTLASKVALLRKWDCRWDVQSEATTLAVYWGTEVLAKAAPLARAAGVPSEEFVATRVSPDVLILALSAASARLTLDFGSTTVPWGNVNRFQRVTGDIVQPFNDAGPSIPVPFPSALWGSLASFGARQYPGTKKWYGTSGNSFVAVVEFGPKVRALAVTAGGESGHPDSIHFNDQAERYAAGTLREVYFYPEQLVGHLEQTYHPGAEVRARR